MESPMQTRREFTTILGTGTLALTISACKTAHSEPKKRPNILWIMLEDWCPDLSCYGTKGVHTPNIDKLAKEGIRFNTAFATAPVCSASRSAMMTGFPQNYIGANQHRTASKNKKPLPYGIKPIPHMLEEDGYYTCLGDHKLDCNFTTKKLFMGKDWSGRKAGQPFFMQYTFKGTHRTWSRDPIRPIKPEDIEIPPYYPDTKLARRGWANGLEQAQITDRDVGKLLKKLKDDGLEENTIVILIGDHGRCMPRGKQFLYDGGIKIPLIIRWPKGIKPNQVNNDLVSSLDICQTIIQAAGVKPIVKLPGKDLLKDGAKDQKYIFAARDKMDNTHDSMRAIRSKKYKLILNLTPERAYCQYNWYKEARYPLLAQLNVMNMKGELNEVQAQFMAATKPEFELFDLEKDPYEINNLAKKPSYAKIKKELLVRLNEWRKSIKDQGVSKEFREGGWASTYPTKSLAKWEKILEKWQPWVFRKPTTKMKHPIKGIKPPKRK